MATVKANVLFLENAEVHVTCGAACVTGGIYKDCKECLPSLCNSRHVG